MGRIVIAYAIALSVSAVGTSVSAQSHEEVLAQLDEQLPGVLANDPTRIDWETFGNTLEVEGRQDDAIPGGGAASRYEISKAGAEIYDAGANIPITQPIESGQAVTVGFYARAISSGRFDGSGVVGVRVQRNSAPYPGFGDTVVEIGKEWEWYEVSATADRDMRRDAVIGLQLSGAEQTLEIGQAIVVVGASSIVGGETKRTTRNAAAQETLPEPLKDFGTLLNDPANRNWSFNATVGSFEERADNTIWYGQSARFTNADPSENPWDLSALIPLNTPIREGDRILVAVAARTEQATTADGRGRIGVRMQRNSPPYAGFGDASIDVSTGWQLISAPMIADGDLSEADAMVSLHFAFGEQIIDVGPVFIFRID